MKLTDAEAKITGSDTIQERGRIAGALCNHYESKFHTLLDVMGKVADCLMRSDTANADMEEMLRVAIEDAEEVKGI